MKIKLDIRAKVIYIRRTGWDKDLKKMVQESLCKFDKYLKMPEFEESLISSKEITPEQVEQYNELAKSHNDSLDNSLVRASIMRMPATLKRLDLAIDNDDESSELTLDELESMSDHVNSLKKKITALKKKAKNKSTT